MLVVAMVEIHEEQQVWLQNSIDISFFSLLGCNYSEYHCRLETESNISAWCKTTFKDRTKCYNGLTCVQKWSMPLKKKTLIYGKGLIITVHSTFFFLHPFFCIFYFFYLKMSWFWYWLKFFKQIPPRNK